MISTMFTSESLHIDNNQIVVRYVRLPRFEQLTGYTQKAVRRKIENGVWLEGSEYRRAPDGRIMVDLEGYKKWVEKSEA